MNNLVIGVEGSPRSRLYSLNIEQILEDIKNREMLNYTIEKLGRDQKLSNSDLCLFASMYGVKERGETFKTLNLKRIIDESGRIKNQSQLKKEIQAAKGIIFSSPVYFGDRSSLIDEFISFLKINNLIKDKVVASVSVGAKRNGGQETTNIYILKEVNDHGAYVVGNGPPTSQYGGTAWAGNLGSLREDEFGIMTSIGTGRKVAEIVSLMKDTDFLEDTVKITFWIVNDCGGLLIKRIKYLIEILQEELKKEDLKFQWDIINFIEFNIKRCKACNICPYHRDTDFLYKCKINDDFKLLYSKLIYTNGIIICAYNDINRTVKSVYQKVLERTRQIRRDNFLLTNVPITSFTIDNSSEYSSFKNMFSLKVMTSFLRHNTVIFPPLWEGKNTLIQDLINFIKLCNKINHNKKRYKSEIPEYIPIGY